MRKCCLFIGYILITLCAYAQSPSLSLTKNWQFKKVGDTQWRPAEVPGTVHTDLLANALIPDPFYRDNESKVQWVEDQDWEYKTVFNIPAALHAQKKLFIQFDGLDTYADVWLNGKLIIEADNMFRPWNADVKSLMKTKGNTLSVRFYSTAKKAKHLKSQEKIPHPDNERIYVRKAQYQFGWDWAPRLVTSGIWKEARILTDTAVKSAAVQNKNGVQLITKKDSVGESFYFTVNGKPTFIKGANWIPADSFLPRAKKQRRYEQLIKAAKEANINMLRVWGGGIYEDDFFYDLCDRYGIMVWQDFMFAGAIYPAGSQFLKSIEAEIRYQVQRLKHHPSIVLWCGNNEIQEAWFNWGWQRQFTYSQQDSAKLWNDYKKIFHELIPRILKEEDPERPYWPSSPSLGWGRDSAYKKGDVHYWGVWWGKEPVEKYNEKIGRFVSEYGMQGMPDVRTIKQFSLPQDLDTTCASMKAHQKHPFGWENIKHYIEQKFRTPETFEDLVYVSQLMQADAIKTAIEAHRRNKPVTMGTMFWQWNDCWPVTSWSAVDYYGRKKAMYYEVKRSFKDTVLLLHKKGNKLQIKLDASCETLSNFQFSLSYFNGYSFNKHRLLQIPPSGFKAGSMYEFDLDVKETDVLVKADVIKNGKVILSNVLLLQEPKSLNLQKARVNFKFDKNEMIVWSDALSYGVYIDVPDGVELEDNYFHLLAHEPKRIKFTSTIPIEGLKKQIKIKSLADTY